MAGTTDEEGRGSALLAPWELYFLEMVEIRNQPAPA